MYGFHYSYYRNNICIRKALERVFRIIYKFAFKWNSIFRELFHFMFRIIVLFLFQTLNSFASHIFHYILLSNNTIYQKLKMYLLKKSIIFHNYIAQKIKITVLN